MAARQLRFESVESRLMLSGDGVFELESLLDIHINTNVSYYAVVDDRAAWIVSAGHDGYTLRIYDLATNGASDALTVGNVSSIKLGFDTDAVDTGIPGYIEVLRTVLPSEPVAPISIDRINESTDDVATIDLGTMLRQNHNVRPAVDQTIQIAAANSEGLRFPVESREAISQQAVEHTAPLMQKVADRVRLERSWSFEVALLPHEDSTSIDSPSEQPTSEQSMPVDEAFRDLSATTIRENEIGASNRSRSQLHLSTGDEDQVPMPVELASLAAEDEQQVRDTAFAGWTGHAEVRRYAAAGAILATLAATQSRLPRSDSRLARKQATAKEFPLRVR